MANDDIHHGIAFANRYAHGVARGNFNAATALSRLGTLAADIDRINLAIEFAHDDDNFNSQNYHGLQPIEAFSFYAVGIVTCLEWHARSRLTDLFSFSPTAICPDDLKPLSNTKLMAQMVANEVTAAQLLGGMTNVSSAERYLQIIERVYSGLNIAASPHEIVNAKSEPSGFFDNEVRGGMERLKRIFEYRNEFVHEIGLEVDGSYLMRDTLSADQALTWCRFAIDCIQSLEKQITLHAPTHFPNCLDERGYAKGDVEGLDTHIIMLEDEISAAFANKDRGEAAWQTALPVARSALEAESAMCGELYTRFFENATPVRLALRRGRIGYLNALRNALELLPDRDDNSQS